MLKYERNLACRYFRVIYNCKNFEGVKHQFEENFRDKKQALEFAERINSHAGVELVCMDEECYYQYIFEEDKND